jgi:hypothetical protein
LARAVDDRGLSDEILENATRALHRHIDDTPEVIPTLTNHAGSDASGPQDVGRPAGEPG